MHPFTLNDEEPAAASDIAASVPLSAGHPALRSKASRKSTAPIIGRAQHASLIGGDRRSNSGSLPCSAPRRASAHLVANRGRSGRARLALTTGPPFCNPLVDGHTGGRKLRCQKSAWISCKPAHSAPIACFGGGAEAPCPPAPGSFHANIFGPRRSLGRRSCSIALSPLACWRRHAHDAFSHAASHSPGA
jgi:hypothetical protein